MKKFIVIAVLVFSQLTLAQVIGRVIEVEGNAFLFQGKNPITLQYGSEISDISDVMVEDGAKLSIVTGQNKVLHVSGGTLIKLYKGIIELKNGFVWVESSSAEKGIINTSNSIAHFGEGQFIYSFDNISGKSQILVLEGDVRFSNSLEPELFTKVGPGYFSLIDQKYQNGLPRTPTKVGLNSYKKTKEVFVGFKHLQKTKFESSIWGERKANQDDKSSRSIASIAGESSSSSKKRGRIIFVKSYQKGTRTPASVDGPMKYYMNIEKKSAARRKPEKTNKVAPIRYFGLVPTSMKGQETKITISESADKMKKSQNTTSTRMPASVDSKAMLVKDIQKSSFEKSLEQEVPKNRRNNNEVNHLIDELKTYDQDYKKNY